ncbi:uncharacterized protein EMH_0095210 [Eimeria mitis]|uniref:Uncharacterized protein n=1 Tax=Eimeria mitis TaxID=44415 RepID=U6KIV2_9EIME|nr:uncharacterized protein EMH_0095210 [Eimeria mitis]CDJ36746.1 hypothetical protein, conserved [Eimeria mitis]
MGDTASKKDADSSLHPLAAAAQQPPSDGESMADEAIAEAVPGQCQALSNSQKEYGEGPEARAEETNEIQDPPTGGPTAQQSTHTESQTAVVEMFEAADIRLRDPGSIPADEQYLGSEHNQQEQPFGSSALPENPDTAEQGPTAPYQPETNLAGSVGHVDDNQEVQGSIPSGESQETLEKQQQEAPSGLNRPSFREAVRQFVARRRAGECCSLENLSPLSSAASNSTNGAASIPLFVFGASREDDNATAEPSSSSQTPTRGPETGSVCCPSCNRSFATKKGLSQHLRRGASNKCAQSRAELLNKEQNIIRQQRQVLSKEKTTRQSRQLQQLSSGQQNPLERHR